MKAKQGSPDPIIRKKVARLGGIARAGKYQQGKSSIGYEPPPVICPECGSQDVHPIVYRLLGPELTEESIAGILNRPGVRAGPRLGPSPAFSA